MSLTIYISPATSLKLLSLSDAPALLSVINQSRARLCRYLYWVDHVTDLTSTEEYINERITSTLYNAAWYGIYHDGQLCGVFGVKYVNEQTKIAEMGYWLGDEAVGKGVMLQVLTVLRKQIAEKYDVNFIEFRVLEQNTASLNLAKKAGARCVAVEPFDTQTTFSSQRLLIYRAII